MIAIAIVGSRLDYCNSLLASTSVSNLATLQLVQNTLAWVVTQKCHFNHITPILSVLHWLPVRHRISYKIATITFQVIAVPTAILIPWYVPMWSCIFLLFQTIFEFCTSTEFISKRTDGHLFSRTVHKRWVVFHPRSWPSYDGKVAIMFEAKRNVVQRTGN